MKEYVRNPNLDDQAAQIDQVYREKIVESIGLAVLRGGNSVFKIIHKEYLQPLEQTNDPEEVKKTISNLLRYLEAGYKNAIKFDQTDRKPQSENGKDNE